MRLVIASTAPSSYADVISIDALNQMRSDVLGKTLFHRDQLWVVSDAEVVPVQHVSVTRDAVTVEEKPFILIVDLELAADADGVVEANCELCGRTGSSRPDQVTLCGVPLDVCLRSPEFTRVLAQLMKD